ncbi:MAG: hypothetical protein WCP54_04395, partial [Actinomycetes bacterium]
AAVNITYDDGSAPSVATVVGQRIGDDYLIISSGFHYSSPKLAIKLTNSVSTDSPTPAPAASVSAPVTAPAAAMPVKIIATTKTVCVKGKTVKTVAANAKCPVGYTKKVVKA